MKDFEILSRASAFAVRRLDGEEDLPWHIISSQHVTHPFRYPQYYPPEQYPWLEHITPEHTRITLELREEVTGRSLVAAEVDPATATCHPSRDVALLHMKDQPHFAAEAAAAGLQLEPLQLASEVCPSAAPLLFEGHFLEDAQSDASANGIGSGSGSGNGEAAAAQVLIPRSVRGHFLARSERGQTFARTPSAVLPMGMCGGPVLDHAGAVTGVIEGIVPATNGDTNTNGDSVAARARKLLSGCVVFVDAAPDLHSLVTAAEAAHSQRQRAAAAAASRMR